MWTVMLLEMFRADEVSPEQMEKLAKAVESLPASFKRMLGPARALQTDVLGAANPEPRAESDSTARFENATTYGEIIKKGDVTLGVVGRVDARRRYQAVSQGRVRFVAPEEAPADVTVFALCGKKECAPLADLVKRLASKSGIDFQPYRYTSDRLRELIAEGMTSAEPPSEEQKAAARLLSDKQLRTLAIAVKSSGGLLLGDVAKQVPAEFRASADDLVARLQESKLVDTEIVVICRKTSAQVARAASRELLEQAAGAGIACACGLPLKDERVEEALTITETGRELLDGSRWMSVVVVDELLQIGIPLEAILLEQQAGGDEMDCFADISGELALFELKDKEFSLGNAYSFGAKIGIARPDHPVIVTTEYVGNDAKEHFQRAEMSVRRRPTAFGDEDDQPTIVYVEGIENLRQSLRTLTSEVYASDGRKLIGEALPFAALTPEVVMEALTSAEDAQPATDAVPGQPAGD
jgi:hypothetical protein